MSVRSRDDLNADRRCNPHNRYTPTMPILTHGSDLRLAPTLRPIADGRRLPPKAAFQAVASLGFEAVQLDATMPGVRPRELDTNARRDLAGSIRRAGLEAAGLDFFIPADHYRDPAHLDRAADAASAACTLAADLGRVPLSINLPTADADAGLVATLLGLADGLGVRLVVYDPSGLDALPAWLDKHSHAWIGAGLDPAALLIARNDPVTSAQSLGDKLAGARLSDAKRGQPDPGRTTLGSGDLDIMAYRVSLDLAPSRTGPVVLDLRSLTSPDQAAATAKAKWDSAAMKL